MSLIMNTLYLFIHSAVCLTTNPEPLPKRVFHTVRSSASSFDFHYPFFSLNSSSSCPSSLPRLSVISILPSIFRSITYFRRQFLHKLWPIQLAFLLCTLCRLFLCSLTLSNTSSFLTRSVQLIYPSPAPHSKMFQVFLIYFLKCQSFRDTQRLCSRCVTLLDSSLKLSGICW